MMKAEALGFTGQGRGIFQGKNITLGKEWEKGNGCAKVSFARNLQ